jgi:uncharacterized protein with von Willebrand factor type A (vWA) domain
MNEPQVHETDDLTGLLSEGAGADVLDAGQAEHIGGLRTKKAASPTVLDLDQWTKRQGRTLTEQWKQIDDGEPAEASPGNTVLGSRVGRAKTPKTPTAGSLRELAELPDGDHIAADSFGALFEAKPGMAEDPASPDRAAYWKTMLESDTYRGLHSRTTHDLALAGVGAAELARQYVGYLADQPEQPEGEGGKGKPDPSSPEGIKQEVGRMRSARKAMKAARDAVDGAEVAAQGLGGEEPGKLAPKDLAKMARMAAENKLLRAILMAAGRYRARAASLQRERLDAPRGTVTGITLSGNLSLAISTEQAMIAGALPALETMALYRFATGRLLSYRHKEKTPVAAGPIIISVDESGSMSGEPIIAAKGIALAMAWVARQQNRPCILSAFAGTPQIRVQLAEGGPGVPKPSPKALADWCIQQIGGGTIPDGPLATITETGYLDLENAKGKTDHIIITDEQMSLDDQLRDSYKEWARRRNVRTYLICIGSSTGDLAQVADRAWTVTDLSLGQGAVEAVLSIGAE